MLATCARVIWIHYKPTPVLSFSCVLLRCSDGVNGMGKALFLFLCRNVCGGLGDFRCPTVFLLLFGSPSGGNVSHSVQCLLKDRHHLTAEETANIAAARRLDISTSTNHSSNWGAFSERTSLKKYMGLATAATPD